MEQTGDGEVILASAPIGEGPIKSPFSVSLLPVNTASDAAINKFFIRAKYAKKTQRKCYGQPTIPIVAAGEKVQSVKNKFPNISHPGELLLIV